MVGEVHDRSERVGAGCRSRHATRGQHNSGGDGRGTSETTFHDSAILQRCRWCDRDDHEVDHGCLGREFAGCRRAPQGLDEWGEHRVVPEQRLGIEGHRFCWIDIVGHRIRSIAGACISVTPC